MNKIYLQKAVDHSSKKRRERHLRTLGSNAEHTVYLNEFTHSFFGYKKSIKSKRLEEKHYKTFFLNCV